MPVSCTVSTAFPSSTASFTAMVVSKLLKQYLTQYVDLGFTSEMEKSLDNIAEGDLDFRGTLGVAKDVPIGFKQIRLNFELDTDATEEQLTNLIRLTERYCVVYQTLNHSPNIAVSHRVTSR